MLRICCVDKILFCTHALFTVGDSNFARLTQTAVPPYSPDYNPIEEAFSKLKSSMKAMEEEAQFMDMDTVILSAFTTITPTDCEGWIRDSEIYY